MSSTTHGTTPYYFVPGPSRYPVDGRRSACSSSSSAPRSGSTAPTGAPSRCACGIVWLCWRAVPAGSATPIGESEGGQYGHKIDLSFRWSMSWFIFSEVMFFGAFFSALWWMRAHLDALRSAASTTRCCGPTSRPCGPPGRQCTGSPAGIVEPFQTMGPFWLPTINTALLLTSGVTLTIAHHALRDGHRAQDDPLHVAHGAAGRVFLGVQGYEYYPRLQRPEPEADLGRLRLDLLHADRLPRLPRARRHADAAVHHAAR